MLFIPKALLQAIFPPLESLRVLQLSLSVHRKPSLIFIGCWVGCWMGCFFFCHQDRCVAQNQPQLVHEWGVPITSIVKYAEMNQVLVATPGKLMVLGADGKLVRSLEMPLKQITSITIDNDAHCIIAGGSPGQSGSVLRINLQNDQITRTVHVLDDVVMDIATDSKQSKTWGVGVTGELFSIDWATNESVIIGQHAKAITSIIALGDFSLVTTSEDSSLRLWDSVQGTLLRSMQQHTDAVLGSTILDAATDQPMIATWSLDRTVRFWQPHLGRMARFIALTEVPNCGIYVAENGSFIVGDRRGKLHWIDWRTARCNRTIDVETNWISAIELASSNDFLWVGTMSGRFYRIAIGD